MGHSAAATQGAVCQRAGALPRGTFVSLWHCPAHIDITGLYITFDTGWEMLVYACPSFLSSWVYVLFTVLCLGRFAKT